MGHVLQSKALGTTKWAPLLGRLLKTGICPCSIEEAATEVERKAMTADGGGLAAEQLQRSIVELRKVTHLYLDDSVSPSGHCGSLVLVYRSRTARNSSKQIHCCSC